MSNVFNTRPVTLTIAAAAALMIAAAAAAQTSEAPISVSVHYADLNISQAAGARTLLQRIQSASIPACGGAPDIRLLAERAAFEQCRKAAIGQAVARVDSPRLTALASHGVEPVRVAGR
jgi:UrcA family protein